MNYLFPNTQQGEWASWKYWQEAQDPSTHYTTYAPITELLQSFPKSYIPEGRRTGIGTQIWYCFGEFRTLLLYGEMNTEQLCVFINTLLIIYDKCKGPSRKWLWGDPYEISAFRIATTNQDFKSLETINWKFVEYPIGEIHAHTVAQYHLSTLICRLACHILAEAGYILPHIAQNEICDAYSKRSFLKYNIDTHLGRILNNSLHHIETAVYRGDIPLVCKVCGRCTTVLKGKNSACDTCFRNQICLHCSSQEVRDSSDKVIRGEDNLPRCISHMYQ